MLGKTSGRTNMGPRFHTLGVVAGLVPFQVPFVVLLVLVGTD